MLFLCGAKEHNSQTQEVRPISAGAAQQSEKQNQHALHFTRSKAETGPN